jgi:hypothetical protein
VQSAEVVVDGKIIYAGALDDLYFQATTRGGRVMDHILANKAVFKTATGVAGEVGILGGVIAATQRDRTSQEVGLGLIAAGVISSVVSAATTPAADVRAWDNLPHYLGFASAHLTPGEHLVNIVFCDASGKELPRYTKSFEVNVPADGKDKVVFASDQSLTPQNL